MKKLLFLLLLIPFFGNSQVKQVYSQFGSVWKRIDVTQGIRFPRNPVSTKDLSDPAFDTAQVYYNAADSSLRIWTGTQWKDVATTSGGSGTVTGVGTGYGLFGGTITTAGTIIADTNLLASVLRLIKIRDSLGALIALKLNTGDTTNKWVNLVQRVPGKDSIIFWIGGTRYAIKDSAGGGGSGTNNANVGSGYRLLKPSSQEIKTLFAGYGFINDSTTNTDGITQRADTTAPAGLATRPYVRSKIDTLLELILLRVRYADTASMLTNYRHWAAGYITSAAITGKLNISDTAAMLANYRHWTVGYVTGSRLADTAAAIRADFPAPGGISDTSHFMSKDANGYYWVKLSDSISIHARDGAELFYIPAQDSIIMLGGWHRDSIPASTKHIYKYNRTMSAWRRLPDAPWTNGLHCFGSHYQNDTIYVWGGDAESPTAQEFWSFKVSTSTWTLIRSSIVSSRSNYGDAWIGNEAYMFGGYVSGATDSTNAITEIKKGSPDGTAWSTVATGHNKLGGLYSGSVVYFNGYLYLIAGVGWEDEEEKRNYKKIIYRSSDNGVTWTAVGDVPFIKSGVFGTGKGFIKLKPSYDGKRLFLFFGYQREPSVGIKDFGECLYMDVDESWHRLPTPPNTGKRDANTLPNRHATAATALPDGSMIIATGFLWNDAWMLVPYDAKRTNGGDSNNIHFNIGSVDNQPVKIMLHDTARLDIRKDSITALTTTLVVDDRLNQFAGNYNTIGKFRTISNRQIHSYVYPGGDSIFQSYGATVGGDVGGYRLGGTDLGTFNAFLDGSFGFGYQGFNTTNPSSLVTMTSGGSSSPVLHLRGNAETYGWVFNGDGTASVIQSVGTTYFTYADINGTDGFAISTASTPIALVTQTVKALAVNGTTANINIPLQLTVGGTTPDASAQLDVQSTTKGFLPPRMTYAQRDAISSPVSGLVIHNTQTNKLNYFNGSVWKPVGDSTGAGGSALGYHGTYGNGTDSIWVDTTFYGGRLVFKDGRGWIKRTTISDSISSTPTDDDAELFFANAGITDAAEKSAYTTFVTTLKANGTSGTNKYAKRKAIYPFLGSTSTSTKYNAADPDDDDASYRITWTGGWTYDAMGVTGNGSTGVGNTHITPTTTFASNDAYTGAYINSNVQADTYDVGAYDAGTGMVLAGRLNDGKFYAYANANFGGFTTASSIGYISASHTAGNNHDVYKDGVNINNRTEADARVAYEIYIGCVNISGTASLHSNRSIGMLLFFDGLTTAEDLDVRNAVLAFVTALGRN